MIGQKKTRSATTKKFVLPKNRSNLVYSTAQKPALDWSERSRTPCYVPERRKKRYDWSEKSKKRCDWSERSRTPCDWLELSKKRYDGSEGSRTPCHWTERSLTHRMMVRADPIYIFVHVFIIISC